MAGEFLYFAIYVLQQLGVMLGVGAQTVLLCTHLIAVHKGEAESNNASYARAARAALGVGLFLMIISGAGAVTLHVLNGQLATILTPAFLFKWILIAALLGAFFTTRSAISNNVLYALTGGSWYALFLVHSLAPVTNWVTLFELYAAWMVSFALVWTVFVAFMHWRRTPAAPKQVPIVKKEIPKEMPKPVPPPPVAPIVHVPPPPPAPKPIPPPPKPAPVVAAPLPVVKPVPPPPVVMATVPKPIVKEPVHTALPPLAPVATSVVKAPKVSWWARIARLFARKKTPVSVPPLASAPAPSTTGSIPTHTPLTIAKEAAPVPAKLPTALPVVHPLSLEMAHTTPAMPPPASMAVPVVANVPAPAPEGKKSFLEEVIDHLHVPALRIMPQRVEDIGKQNRPPVVKLGDEL